MPLKKLLFKPGVNRENTRYTTEGGYYECDKIRFRQGTPEKIGGWQRISDATYLGVCRSLWNWLTLGFVSLIGVGTNLKFYMERGGNYYDITPIRAASTLNGPFTATTGSSIITVTDNDHGAITGDFVTFNGAVSLGGAITADVLNQEYQITFLNINQYTINVSVAANSSDTGHGGATVRAVYQANTGFAAEVPNTGWGTGAWGYGTWGNGQATDDALRLWSQSNFGQDLIFGPRGGPIYYWSTNPSSSIGLSPAPVTFTDGTPAVITFSIPLRDLVAVSFTTTGALPPEFTTGTTYYIRNYNSVTGEANLSATPTGALIAATAGQSGDQYFSPRAVYLAELAGASDVPVVQNYTFVSDIYRFVFAFGCNDYTTTEQNPLLIRWSDQEDATNWTPSATNQAGSLPLSHGSRIITCLQTRQEILVWTDSSLYSMQYLGPPYVWNAQLLGDNISIINQNAAAIASGVVYWMGIDKFYKYDGRIQTLRCDLRQYIFEDINLGQTGQIFGSTNEGFNEVWWFYCSAGSTTVDKYVIYNYLEDIWYYGTMARTAWLDTGTLNFPIAATYSNNIVNHEDGLDDNETVTPRPIDSFITSSEFDIDDGHNFGFVWRILPDITFRGSSVTAPQATMTLLPLQSSGSGYSDPPSVGGTDNGDVVQTVKLPVEEFTQYLYIRVRGRQLAFKVENNQLGSAWQLGAPRIDIRPDGRR